MTLENTDRFVVQRDTSTGAVRPVTYQAIVVDPSMESDFFNWFQSRNWFNTGRSPSTYNIGEQTDTDSIPNNSCWIYDFGEPGVQWGYDSLGDIQVTGIGRQYFWTSDDGETFEPFDPPLQVNPDGEDGGYRNYVNFRVPTRYFKFMGDNQYEGKHVFGKSWLDQGVVVPNSYQIIRYTNISFEAFEALNWTGSSDWWWVGGYPEPGSTEGCIYDLGQAGCMWGYPNISAVPSTLDLVAFVSDDGVSWREQVIPDVSYTPQFVVEGRYFKLFDRSGDQFYPNAAFPRYYITDQDYQSKAIYSIQSEKLVTTLQDSDLMVVGRGSTPYKITGKEVKEALAPQETPPFIGSVTLTEDSPGGDRFDNQSFTSTLSWATKGIPEASLEMKATVTGTLDIAGASDEITGFTDSSPATITDTIQIASAINQITVYDDVDGTTTQVYNGSITPEGVLGLNNYPDLWTPVNPNPYKNGSNMAAGIALNTAGPLSITCIGSDPFKLLTVSNKAGGGSYSYTITGDVTVTGVTGGSVGRYEQLSDEVTITPNTSGATFTITANDLMYINYVPLGGDDAFFTLASDVNLANGVFQAGDLVKQNNSPLVPTSSAITNVLSTATPVYSDYATAVDGWYGSYTIEKAFNGINNADGGAVPNTGQPIVYAHPVNVVVEKIELKVYSTVNLTLPDGTVVSVEGNSGQDVWHEGEIPGGSFTFTGSNSISIKEPGGTTYFDGIKLNGVELIDNQVIEVLTLQDASGLSDFEVGDEVTSGAPITATVSAIDIYALYYEDGSESTSPLTSTDIAAEIGEQNYFNDDINDANKTGNKGFYTYSDNTITIAYAGLTAGDSIGIVAGTPSATASGNDLFMSATGDVENSGIPFVGYEGSTLQGDKNSLPKTRSNVIVTASSGSFVLANDTDGGGTTSQFYIHWIEGLAEGVVTITAIDEATPSITTEGGDWTVGEVVTGPPKPITATFVSADPSVPSMTVSDVVGPWSANTGNYVENTVVNPVLIKPETSAITAVTQEQGVDFSGSSTLYDDKEQSFDGDINTLGGAVSGTELVVFELPVTINSSIAYYSPDSVGRITTWYFTREDGQEKSVAFDQKTNNGWTNVPLPDGWALPFTCIKLDAIRQVDTEHYNAIRVDGTILVDVPGPTALTFTDDTDLNQFATGDAVYAGGVATASFAPVLYTGNSGTQSITTGFAPDLVWLKSRTEATDHGLFDTVRGAGKGLYSNLTNSEFDISTTLSSFTADGFTLGDNTTFNGNGQGYVAWCWSAGDTTVTNNDGTIESQVRSNGDFSIVKYTGTGQNIATIGHGLNTAPSFIILKTINQDVGWPVYHISNGFNGYMGLNDTFAFYGANAYTNVNDTTFTTGNDGWTIPATNSFIAYCWAESPTQSFGSYTGNGSTTGPVINCGFEPAFVMVKSITTAYSWNIVDSARGVDKQLYADLSNAENPLPNYVEFTSTGFKVITDSADWNQSGQTFVYAAFASAGGASGVVGDITGLDMTLSESTGTWEVGQTVTMDEKPAVETTANLIFDSSGAVTGLTTGDVTGQLMFNKDTPKLSFTEPGTGLTWDEELPAGTKLQTSFTAINTEGTSSATSNVITPGEATKLSMGETINNKENVAKSIVQMQTFDERKAIIEGETAKNKIESTLNQAKAYISKLDL